MKLPKFELAHVAMIHGDSSRRPGDWEYIQCCGVLFAFEKGMDMLGVTRCYSYEEPAISMPGYSPAWAKNHSVQALSRF